jgi:hypothetical protein
VETPRLGSSKQAAWYLDMTWKSWCSYGDRSAAEFRGQESLEGVDGKRRRVRGTRKVCLGEVT